MEGLHSSRGIDTHRSPHRSADAWDPVGAGYSGECWGDGLGVVASFAPRQFQFVPRFARSHCSAGDSHAPKGVKPLPRLLIWATQDRRVSPCGSKQISPYSRASAAAYSETSSALL